MKRTFTALVFAVLSGTAFAGQWQALPEKAPSTQRQPHHFRQGGAGQDVIHGSAIFINGYGFLQLLSQCDGWWRR